MSKEAESFLCPCLSYLMMSTREYCICRTVNRTLKQSSQYIFSFLVFFFFSIILLYLYRMVVSRFFFSLTRCIFFSIHRCLLKCMLTTMRCHRASSFDINRAAVCHFHIFSSIGTCNELFIYMFFKLTNESNDDDRHLAN
jgi:hypothetical protein